MQSLYSFRATEPMYGLAIWTRLCCVYIHMQVSAVSFGLYVSLLIHQCKSIGLHVQFSSLLQYTSLCSYLSVLHSVLYILLCLTGLYMQSPSLHLCVYICILYSQTLWSHYYPLASLYVSPCTLASTVSLVSFSLSLHVRIYFRAYIVLYILHSVLT